jgi:hypothetical protein
VETPLGGDLVTHESAARWRGRGGRWLEMMPRHCAVETHIRESSTGDMGKRGGAKYLLLGDAIGQGRAAGAGGRRQSEQ